MIPSFEELLSQAQALSQRNADAESKNRTYGLLGKGLSELVTGLWGTSSGDKETYVGSATPSGVFTPFEQPKQSGLTAGEMFFDKMFKSNRQLSTAPKGQFLVSKKAFEERALPSIFKQKASTEQTLGSQHTGMTGEELSSLYGIPGLTPDTTFNQMKTFKQKNTPISAQSALASHFSNEDEMKTLFPEITDPAKWMQISTSQVADRRTQNRGIAIERAKATGPKPLNTEQAKAVAAAKDGVEAIDRMQELLKRKPEVFRRAGDLLSIGDKDSQAFTRDKKIAADAITRIRTGAALNKQEEEFYPSLISTIFSNTEIVPENLDLLKNFYGTLQDEINSGLRGLPGGVAPTAPPKKDKNPLAKTTSKQITLPDGSTATIK